MVSAYQANLETYHAQHPALHPDYWIPQAKVFDATLPMFTEDILPMKKVGNRRFKWRTNIGTGAMAPYKGESTKTPMITAYAMKEEYETRRLKVGFNITEDELDEGLPGVMEQLTQECIAMIKRRMAFVNLFAMQGITWNAVSTARMHALTRPTWQASGGTPIADVLIMMLRVWKRAGVRPDTIYLGPDEHFFLQNHNTIVTYLGLGSGIRGESDLLCRDMIYCIKSLNIKVVDSQYKESPWSYALWQAGTPFPGAPGLGDLNADSSTNVSIRWMLRDRAIITAGKLGFTAYTKNPGINNHQWVDDDTGDVMHKFEAEFCPVIEDYARLGVITFTGTTRGTDDHPTQL